MEKTIDKAHLIEYTFGSDEIASRAHSLISTHNEKINIENGYSVSKDGEKIIISDTNDGNINQMPVDPCQLNNSYIDQFNKNRLKVLKIAIGH